MTEKIYRLENEKVIRIRSRKAFQLFDECYVVGDMDDLIERKSQLQAAVLSDRYNNFRNVLKECRGTYWGWFKVQDRFVLFTDIWGCARLYITQDSKGSVLIFEEWNSVKDIMRLSTTLDRIITYMVFSYIPGNDTLFQNVWLPSPGLIHEYKNGSWTIHGKYDVYVGSKNTISLDEASKEFAELIHRAVGRVPDGPVVIPISGGLDSRVLLASMLEYKAASDIHTFTFGGVGTMDYVIGNEVAKYAGTTHTAYPLTINDYSLEAVRASAEECFGQIFFTPEAPLSIWEDKRWDGMPMVVGFMGDSHAGARVKYRYMEIKYLEDWQKTLFAYHFVNNPKDISLLFKDKLIDVDTLRRTLVDRYMISEPFENAVDFVQLSDNWDFYHRQRKYINYCVSKNSLHKTRYIYPFLDLTIAMFTLSLQSEYRIDCVAYKKGLIERFPKLFGIRVKNSYGGRCHWSKQPQYKKYLNLLLYAARERLLKGQWDPYLTTDKIPFWEYTTPEKWDVIRYILTCEDKYSFLNFEQIRDDIDFVSSHSLYAYKRGPQYGRILAVTNLIIALEVMNVDVV